MVIKTKTFGVAGSAKSKSKAKPKPPPVKRTWDTTHLTEAKVTTYRRQISASIIDDETELAKAFHRAVMAWRERTNDEHPGKVYLETTPTGQLVPDANGVSSLNVIVHIVVESAPELSAR